MLQHGHRPLDDYFHYFIYLFKNPGATILVIDFEIGNGLLRHLFVKVNSGAISALRFESGSKPMEESKSQRGCEAVVVQILGGRRNDVVLVDDSDVLALKDRTPTL